MSFRESCSLERRLWLLRPGEDNQFDTQINGMENYFRLPAGERLEARKG